MSNRKIIQGVIFGLTFALFLTFLGLYIKLAVDTDQYQQEAVILQKQINWRKNMIEGYAEEPSDGFIITKGYLDEEEVDALNASWCQDADGHKKAKVNCTGLFLASGSSEAFLQALKDNERIVTKLEDLAKRIFPDVSLDYIKEVPEGQKPITKRPDLEDVGTSRDGRHCTDFANLLTEVKDNRWDPKSELDTDREMRSWHADFFPQDPRFSNWKVVGLNIALKNTEEYTGMPFELRNPTTGQGHSVRLGKGDIAAFRPDICHRVSHDVPKSGLRHQLVVDVLAKKPMPPLNYHPDARPPKSINWDPVETREYFDWKPDFLSWDPSKTRLVDFLKGDL